MAKISKPKCKFCGAPMEKKQTLCPACGQSKNMELAQCIQCGVNYAVDPRDQSARLCPKCFQKKSNKRILIKAGIIGAFIVILVFYRIFKNMAH